MSNADKKLRDAAILNLIDAVECGGHGLEIHPADPANPGFGWDVLIYTWGRRKPQRFNGDSLAQACGIAFTWFKRPHEETGT